MMRHLKLYLLPVICLCLIVLAEWLTPPPINWFPSFSAADKIPYGTYVSYRLMSRLFPDTDIRAVQITPYELLHAESFERTTYVFINDSFAPDPVETAALIEFVEAGNHVFIAADMISGPLADSLRIETTFNFVRPESALLEETAALTGIINADSTIIDFVNPALKSGGYRYKKGTVSHYFEAYDSSGVVILGVNNHRQVNYLKMPRGAGVFWLNAVPHAFTNYNVLDPVNRGYLERATAYLPADHDILWDEHHKSGRREVRTPLRYVLSRPALRWAYSLTLFTVVLFILFEGKRRRRAIPVLKPLPNDTLEFVDTTGRLYYQRRNHQNIIQKKFTYFQEHLRTHYALLIPAETTEVWFDRAAEKTGRPAALLKEICDAAGQSHPTDQGLLRFNRLIEQFHENDGTYTARA